eukprot:CAMPEP_0197657688 /NCGR_PEP_ID=MMETSP1338-20131121/44783_1 /TAXON_ID=43686 ORGANISM="Pelagodinium beii, Strain RCC1491" /NCGR_SAMPLE_ID=MMETSP1338 /ASSEMBLY_ACC=CAM_ASM_000754 /LENGTH=334 /DNA_ID=CAMNT_0043234119 /DNA_START=33 /DNA_END=1037 /DNA_ORIENTATION=+
MSSTTSLWSDQENGKLADLSGLEDEDSTDMLPVKYVNETTFQKDAWTQAFLGLLLYHDRNELTCDERNWFFASMLLYVTNFILQIGLIMMILQYVVDPMESATQPPIFDMKAAAELLQDPRLQGQRLEGSESYQVSSEKAELVVRKCESLDVAGLFRSQLFMLFLWNTRIVKEVGDSMHTWVHLRSCERRRSLDQPLVEGSTLVRVDSQVLWMSSLLVQIPMLTINVLLWSIGSKLIVFGIAPFTVVLKGLALQFLVTIDELLFDAFASPKAQELLGKFKVRYHLAAAWPKWNHWGSTVFKFSVAVGVTAFTIFVQFADLPNFRSACDFYDRAK